MKKISVVAIFLLLLTFTLSSFGTVEVNALDFAGDYFTVSNAEVKANSTVPNSTGITDYRYGMRMSASKDGANVVLNDTFVGKFSIDLMPYSLTTYGSTQYETASYSNTYQDLNTLSLNFKNKSDNKEFKVVLNGGATGNNVTVNAHVNYNNEKMGLYYPSTNKLVGNTKGANANDVYTFLWGTSFSNMAVSSEAYSSKNVKSLKIEFDPITMCVYGYSYGYSRNSTEKMLIWDLSKSSMDGSDAHSTISSFDEYEVSICFDKVNSGKTANVLIYNINGQSFSNTVITNNIGPVSSVKLNEGKLKEKYYLPTPKAYDVLEGIIAFKGDVTVLDPTGNNVIILNDNNGNYFVPETSGSYKVSYVAKDAKGLKGEALVQYVSITSMNQANFNHNLESELYYSIGDTFNVPSAKLSINGVEHSATAKVYSPSNEVINGSSIKLSSEGLYKLSYTATIDGIYYEDIININVSSSVSELFNAKNCLSQEYSKYMLNNNVSGLVVKTNVETNSLTYKEALDLSYLDGETCLISMQMNPTIWGTSQSSAITIKLIDANDATNYVRVYCVPGTSADESLVRAGSNEQRLAGLGSDGLVSQTSSGGTVISHSFTGVAENANIADQTFEVYFDYSTKRIYTSNKSLVADLDDTEYFSTLWNGFSGDKFYIEISVSGIVVETSYLIDTIAGVSLVHENYVDVTKPVISYNENDFIDGVINQAYPIPQVVVKDATSDNIISNITVSLNGKEIEVSNNKFVPTQLGRYVITYEYIDNFGNISTLVKRVLVKESVAPITINVENVTISGNVGEHIMVPGYVANGGSGELEVVITAIGKNTGEKYIVKNLQFIPLVADEYTISYTASDKLGNVNINTVELTATIILSSKPIIEVPEYVPSVLVDGNTTIFAETVAYDYNNINDNNVEVELFLLVEGNEIKVEDYEHCLSLQTMNTTVKLIYRATSTITNDVAELTYEIPAVKLLDDEDNLVLPQYLITNGFDSYNVTDESIDLTTTTSHSTIEFIKNVYSDGFQIGFNVPAAANNVDKVTIYLTDVDDQNKVIKLDVVKANLSDSFSYLIINDDVKVTMLGTFYGTTANRLKVVYDGSLNAIKDDSGLVVSYLKTYLNGETFVGFGSEINFKIELGEVTGTTIFKLYEVGNQMMSNIDGDYTVPAIVYEDEIARIANVGDIVTIPSAKAIDILGFETTLTIRVLSPDKKNVYTSNNGEGTTLEITQYGVYYVYYIGSDENYNSLTQLKVITVLDDIAPTINVNEISKTAKVNDVLTLPNPSCTDNVSSAENIKTLIFTIDPNNVMKEVTSNKVTFKEKGTYTIRYFAIDEAGNVAIYDTTVEVK